MFTGFSPVMLQVNDAGEKESASLFLQSAWEYVIYDTPC